MKVLGFVLGLAIVVGVTTSVFTTLVVPRTTSSRLLRGLARVLARVGRTVLKRIGSYEVKDRVLAIVGPLALVLLFVLWLAALVVGFGFMAWWTNGTTLGSAMKVAGSSVFTLGFATGSYAQSEVLEFVAAGMGLLVIALEIAYLPALYSSFSTRETAVTILASRAGVPAWGPEILARHHWFRTTDELPALYARWEEWSASVAESHTSYPTLMWFRSPVSTRSWLLALLAMLDAAALQDSLNPGTTPRQARVMLAGGTDCLRALARALRIRFDPDPRPVDGTRLTYEEFQRGIHRLKAVGYAMERSPEEAWRNFQGWRINYEHIVDVLTELVMPPPAPWLLPRPGLGAVRWPVVVDRTPDDPDPAKGTKDNPETEEVPEPKGIKGLPV
jgi:hypothetical protein